MANLYYKRTDVVGDRYYRAPRYIEADFSGIKGREIVVSQGDRLDIIAQNLFGDASYWRALALYNNIGYFFDLVPGTILVIPHNIQEVLNRI